MSCSGLLLYNYCHPALQPLMNIMRLEKRDAFRLAAALAEKHRGESSFYRFADFENYYALRERQDRYLYEQFIALGGRPEEEHPLSFSVGECAYLKEWFSGGKETVLRLSDISSCHISFTLGDSGALIGRDGKVKVLTKEAFLEAYEAAGRSTSALLAGTGCGYVEAQLWSDCYIR